MSHVYSGEGNGTPLQYSCLENPMDGGAWWAAVHGVTKSPTGLSDFTFTHWRKWQPTPVLPGESGDGGPLWAAIYGVAQSRTQLKWLSSSSNMYIHVLSVLGAQIEKEGILIKREGALMWRIKSFVCVFFLTWQLSKLLLMLAKSTG